MNWTRHGECNGCGFCCQTFTRQAVVRNPAEVEDLAFYEARGFTPMQVDGRRRLVLFRRDNVEHLVLLGINGDVVIESAIATPDFGEDVRSAIAAPTKTEPKA